jgi:hypothetical protein
MKKTAVVAIISAVLWLSLALLGWNLLQGVNAQNAPGYPNNDQFRYYLYFPLALFGTSLLLVLLSTRYRLGGAFGCAPLFLILMIAPYMLAYTGGV